MRLHKLTLKQRQRFWSKVAKSRLCWVWLGAISTGRWGGYGTFYIGQVNGHPQFALAHRVAWLLAGNELPAGKYLCHHCDNPSCINPAHMFVGTAKENMRDAANKGRIVLPRLRGEQHMQAKLTWKNVQEIRRRRSDSGVDLAAEFHVTPTTISSIRLRRTWRA